MKKILLILVGGTITTALNENGTLSVNGDAGSLLESNFKNSDSPYAKKVEFEQTENLFILSENMTVEKWNVMIDTYRKYTVGKKYDGIIFAHGTDTLAYSASLFSMLLSGADIPVFFVSANARLGSPRSNGDANFRCAAECICRGVCPGVYAVYKNISDSQMYLHLASRLEQCKNYSEDFYSVGAVNITDISDENCAEYFKQIEMLYPHEKRKPFVDIYGDWRLSECVLMLQPYVGISYDIFDYSRFRAVLHGTYHSGTACSEKTGDVTEYGKNSILYMLDQCAESDVVAYISPSRTSGEIYETTDIIAKHKTRDDSSITFLYGTTTEAAYAKLLVAYSVFDDKDKISDLLNTECNFEFIDRGEENDGENIRA